MANLCNNYCEISGSDDQLEALWKRLIDQDAALLRVVPNFTIQESSDYCIYGEDCITRDQDGDICISFGSKWNCPLDGITSLSVEYPDLEFNFRFDEGDNDYYGTASIIDGSCTETEMEEVDYIEAFHVDYIDQRDSMLKLNYDEFVKSYTHDNFFDEYPFGCIDRHVVKRIKDKDLPKFLNRQWFDDEAEQEYKGRLSGGSKK